MNVRGMAATVGLLLVVGCTSSPAPTSKPDATPTATEALEFTPAPSTPAPQSPSSTAGATPPPSSPSAKPSATPSATLLGPPASPIPSPSAGPSITPSPSSNSTRPIFRSVDDAYAQTVTLRQCSVASASAQCATVFVPTSYEQPGLGTTAIAVARFPASGASQGDLFVNPGGPGSGGIGFGATVATNAPELSANFDIVGFDPRGTGKSDPLLCLDTPAFDALNAFDPTPETAEQRQQGIDLIDAQGQACATNSGLLAGHVTTIETARDMDVLRAVLGDDKLNYFGFSYGTFLGTTYAALFPDKVGRYALDGALPPGLNTIEASEVQTSGIQTALEAYIKDCVMLSSCPLGTNAAEAESRLRQILEDVDHAPLPTNDAARPLTQALAFFGIAQTLYNRSSWSDLSIALSAALVGNGQLLLSLSDDYFRRTSDGYVGNFLQANQAINCLDEEVAGGPTPIPEKKFVADSPIVGDIMFGLADRGCGNWPLTTTVTAPDYSAPGAPPILVIGTTRDPATPYIWAQQLANTLDSAVLLIREGDGHTAYFSGNSCITHAVDAFFTEGTVPAAGTTC